MPEHDYERENGSSDYDGDPRHVVTPIQDDLRPSAPSRASRRGLTENPVDSFDELWSETAESLEALLRARGLAAQDRADVVQEVAVHALRAHANGTINSSFSGWCKAVARNTMVAMHRRDRWIDLTDEIDAEARDEDVEYRVERRLELDALASVWQTLDADQRALLADADPPVDTAARNRHYVALHRLRKRVQLLADSALLGLSTVIYAARRRSTSASVAAALGAVGIVASLTIGVADLKHVAPADEPARTTRTTALEATAPPSPGQTTTGGADTTRHEIDTSLPAGHRAYVWIRPSEEPDEPLVCARVSAVMDRACVAHPLRRDVSDPIVTVAPNGQ